MGDSCESGSEQITVKQIARTEDTDDPVFRAESDYASMTFLFPPEEPHDVWIHTVRSSENGGMSDLLDHICREYDCRKIRFVNVLNDNIEKKLDNATVIEEVVPEPSPYAGETITCVDVIWSVDING